MQKVVVLDACVLYPAPLRDILLHFYRQNLYQGRWSAEIHEEWTRNLIHNRPDLTAKNIHKVQRLMDDTFPDAVVANSEENKSGIQLPDSADIHVLATAIESKADYIITYNLRDFPEEELKKYKIKAIHPDDFLTECINKNPDAAIIAFKNQVKFLKNPKLSPRQVLEYLRKNKLSQTVTLLEKLL